jgi:hypothetical protein
VETTSSPSWVEWAETEVYGAGVGGGSGAGEVNWLVTDHLSTSRMVADLDWIRSLPRPILLIQGVFALLRT